MAYKLKLLKSNKYNGKKYPTILHLGEDVYCPLCLKKVNRRHVHHVVWREWGGHDVKENELVICVPCHDAIHHDDEKTGYILRMRLHYYMDALYGLRAEQNEGLKMALKDSYLNNPGQWNGASFLQVYRIAHNLVIKEKSARLYRMSFDENVQDILIDCFYGDGD